MAVYAAYVQPETEQNTIFFNGNVISDGVTDE